MRERLREDVDYDGRYTVHGWPKIAVRIAGHVTRHVDEDGERELDPDWVNVVMIGDDRRHPVEVDELVKIDDDEFCSECGQVGCGWGH